MKTAQEFRDEIQVLKSQDIEEGTTKRREKRWEMQKAYREKFEISPPVIFCFDYGYGRVHMTLDYLTREFSWAFSTDKVKAETYHQHGNFNWPFTGKQVMQSMSNKMNKCLPDYEKVFDALFALIPE